MRLKTEEIIDGSRMKAYVFEFEGGTEHEMKLMYAWLIEIAGNPSNMAQATSSSAWEMICTEIINSYVPIDPETGYIKRTNCGSVIPEFYRSEMNAGSSLRVAVFCGEAVAVMFKLRWC